MGSKKRAILITGGVKRLGLAYAKASLEMGDSVILHYRSSKGDAEELLTKEFPDQVHFIQQELGVTPEHLITSAQALNLQITGLVNNAATFTKGNFFDPGHFERTLSINAITPLRLGTAFHKQVGTGWIINITDANISHPNMTYQNYRISKLLLEEITRQQALLYAPAIRVNAIAPGAMLPSEGNEAYFATLSEKIPLRSTGDLRSLTDAYSFLIKNHYITGQVLRVDGGWGLI
jgi:NAD(P)-dependent dehydrogenase (short-subunit alcohol dehydrogenase family)